MTTAYSNDSDVGVGPHPKPWPTSAQYDRTLLADGDRRNVLDKYRYWTVQAIKVDLDASRLPLQIAVENFQNDHNIGTIIRNANAFNVQAVHIIGRRHYNRRGAMVTDAYMNLFYHSSVAEFVKAVAGQAIIAVDIVPGAVPLGETQLPKHAVLVFGGEGPGLSADMLAAAEKTIVIEQFGSTRSVNVGVAAGIAMYAWTQQHQLRG